jgi:hypothetical protein
MKIFWVLNSLAPIWVTFHIVQVSFNIKQRILQLKTMVIM